MSSFAIENATKICGTVTSNSEEIIDEFGDPCGVVMDSLNIFDTDSANPCERNQKMLMDSSQLSLASEEQDRLSTR